MKRLFLATLIALLSVAIVIPSSVIAGANGAFCNYNPTNHTVTVHLNGPIGISYLSRDVAGHIKVDGEWCGGAATVTNTDKIDINGDDAFQQMILQLANGGFRPGYTNEPGKSDEIEFTLDLMAGGNALRIYGTESVQKFDLGQKNLSSGIVRKINLNAGESTGVDSDMLIRNVNDVTIDALGGNDRIRATGLQGTGPDPWSLPLTIFAGSGSDIVRGGSAGDWLYAMEGAVDQVWGNGGPDTIYLQDDAGGDVGHGGAGTDTCFKDNGDTCYQN